jgi:hypothetical protein
MVAAGVTKVAELLLSPIGTSLYHGTYVTFPSCLWLSYGAWL